jgi:putative DNA primase/helicase
MTIDDARAYLAAGWHPIPLPAGRKHPPPGGLTGYAGRYLDADELDAEDWSGNLATRLRPTVAGVDIDAYAGGLDSLHKLEAELGALPPTVVSHSGREDGSGIRLYRVPVGTLLATDPAEGIDIVQAHHRYVMCWPSIHPEGRPYGWLDERTGEILELPPAPDELPELPAAWLAWLAAAETKRAGASRAAVPDEAAAFVAEHTDELRPRALRGVLTKLAGVTRGGRHDALVEAACWLMREAAAGWYPAGDAFDALEEWWSSVTVGEARDGELDAAVLWAIGQRDACAEEIARKRAEAEEEQMPPGTGTVEAALLEDPDSWVDSMLGEELAAELRPSWRYVTAWRQWVRWDGRRWATDETEAVHETARVWMLELGSEALKGITSRKDPMLRKVLAYRQAGPMENLVKVARRILAVAPTAFDVDPHLLNTLNGVVDLRTGELGPHEQTLMMTRLAGAAYLPDARHPDITAALACLDADDRRSVQMLLGVAASGHTGGDHLPVFDGGGANGKTTVLLGAGAALGDYAGPVPPELIMKSQREDHPTIKTTLHGRRLAYIEETEEDGGLRLERLKAITGGAPLEGRRIGGNYYSWTPTHTLILATNHRPSVNTAEHAAWRRLHLIPFPHRYGSAPGDLPIDSGLRERVQIGRAQREAMLAFIVAGAVAAYAAGEEHAPVVVWSPGIVAATAAWRANEDVIGRFADSELVFEKKARVTLATMFERYKSWCEHGNRAAGQDKLFAQRFEAHDVARDVQRIRPQDRVTYVGVRLRRWVVDASVGQVGQHSEPPREALREEPLGTAQPDPPSLVSDLPDEAPAAAATAVEPRQTTAGRPPSRIVHETPKPKPKRKRRAP